MITGRYAACKKTGFVMAHAAPCESVAARMTCIILFREPGKPAEGLIADNYGMKGFRIDTKSCNWGPMRGFVCADPRLSKPKAAKSSYRTRNVEWTEEAIAGHIKHVLDERESHRAPVSRFRDELEDHMTEEGAEGTLRAIISWARFAEAFAYDEDSGVFSLDNPS